DIDPVETESNDNVSSKQSDSSVQIRFIVANVSVLTILQQPDFEEGIKDALGNAIASMSDGAKVSDI
ncbi:pol, partial [Symbiodinium sp. KB8]